MKFAFTVAAFSAVLIAGALAPSTGYAHSAFPPGAEPRAQGPQSRSASTHKLANSTIDYGNPNESLGTGYNLIDSNTVNCNKPTCTISVDTEEEVGGADSTGNLFAVCGYVDGNFGVDGCPYTGEVPSDYSYNDARTRQTFLVSKGSHTVSFYLYLNSASAYSYGYDVHYDVYTP